MTGKLFLISAPSGAGKTTLVQLIIERYGMQHNIERVITFTSKMPRSNERHGVDYHFISPQEFETKLGQGFFMEWSNAYGAYYGAPASVLAELCAGKSFLLIVDRAGATNIMKVYPASVTIWIHTTSIEELERRLLLRNTENLERIAARLAIAKREIFEEAQVPFYKYHILNNDLELAIQKLYSILKKELDSSI